jgi:hypothetical protein
MGSTAHFLPARVNSPFREMATDRGEQGWCRVPGLRSGFETDRTVNFPDSSSCGVHIYSSQWQSLQPTSPFSQIPPNSAAAVRQSHLSSCHYRSHPSGERTREAERTWGDIDSLAPPHSWARC